MVSGLPAGAHGKSGRYAENSSARPRRTTTYFDKTQLFRWDQLFYKKGVSCQITHSRSGKWSITRPRCDIAQPTAPTRLYKECRHPRMANSDIVSKARKRNHERVAKESELSSSVMPGHRSRIPPPTVHWPGTHHPQLVRQGAYVFSRPLSRKSATSLKVGAGSVAISAALPQLLATSLLGAYSYHLEPAWLA